VQNAFAALGEESDEDDNDVQTVITQMAALTSQSQLTATTTAKTQASVAAAINQLAANQQAMQQQFAAFTTQRNTTYQPRTPTPPITQFTIPNLATFPFEGRRGGQRSGGCGHGGRSNFATTGGCNVRTLFANFTAGQSGLPPIGASGGRGGGMAPFAQQTPARNAAPMYSNILKAYANWNVCFLCGFDVEDGHTSKHVRHNGGGQIIRKDSIEQIRANTFWRGTMRARRQRTKASCRVDIVGQSR
jgi:hypothetical protein